MRTRHNIYKSLPHTHPNQPSDVIPLASDASDRLPTHQVIGSSHDSNTRTPGITNTCPRPHPQTHLSISWHLLEHFVCAFHRARQITALTDRPPRISSPRHGDAKSDHIALALRRQSQRRISNQPRLLDSIVGAVAQACPNSSCGLVYRTRYENGRGRCSKRWNGLGGTPWRNLATTWQRRKETGKFPEIEDG